MYDVDESVTEESSDPPSPPLYEPYIPDELAADPEALAALKNAKAKYKAEQGKIPILFSFFSSLISNVNLISSFGSSSS